MCMFYMTCVQVQNLTLRRLCSRQVVVAVNGSVPGPTIRMHEGDTLKVHVVNNSPYNITIHWHGIFQLLSAWADGPNMITQCPIRPGGNYTYKFTATGQEGTLWWHAHVSTLRATVYGALIIRPKKGNPYPFPKPHKQIPILLGEWWNANVVDVETQALATGGGANISDAYTINGLPGDLYPCSENRHMFVTIGLALEPCKTGSGTCQGPNGQRFAASMNNVSFQFPTTMSLLQAFFHNVDGVYTKDFPSRPRLKLDYTNPNVNNNAAMLFAPKGTKVQKLKFNETVEMVLQNTAVLTVENHPIHLHGFNFHVLAQGFGNYDSLNGPKKFNLDNPQSRNTIGVPVGGWAVLRFQANNPGIWFMHCHLDAHLPWGLAMAFEVENGPTPGTKLPPPPADFPRC
ncbi:LAC7 [Linum grandiflorum]